MTKFWYIATELLVIYFIFPIGFDIHEIILSLDVRPVSAQAKISFCHPL